MKKTAPVLATLLVAALSLTACGGSDSGEDLPSSASKADFCKVMTEYTAESNPVDFIKQLKKTGTPEGVSEDVRAGYVLIVKNMDKFGENSALFTDQEAFIKEFSAADYKKLVAFVTYMATECAAAAQ